MTSLDEDIARLYQLPLSAFTAARNELAKKAGARGAAIRQRPKPPVAAWVVNQLYWAHRDTYEALVEAARALREAHAEMLSGKRPDLRTVARGHEAAVETALKQALSVAKTAGHPATDATRQAIATTLRSLPGEEPPGQLAKALQPSGFEALAGLSIAGGGPRPAPTPFPRAAPNVASKSIEKSDAGPTADTPAADKKRAKALTEARDAAARASRAQQAADQRASQAEFEAARSVREADKAEAEAERLREALLDAQAAVEKAERAAAAAARVKDVTARKSREANDQAVAARTAAVAAKARLAGVER